MSSQNVSSKLPLRNASSLGFLLLLLAVGCSSPTGPKDLSMDVLPGHYAGIGTGAWIDAPGPITLYEAPGFKVEGVAAAVTIAPNLTYNFSGEYRVTRGAEVATVEWTQSGNVRATAGASSNDEFLFVDLVASGSSAPALRGTYHFVCLSGFGLYVPPGPCSRQITLTIAGVVPRTLIPDAADVTFGYVMTKL